MSVKPMVLAREGPLVPSAVLGMAVFLATEIMFFAALLSAFLVLRAQTLDWPPPGQPRLPAAATAIHTSALLISAIVLERAARAARDAATHAVRRLVLTRGLALTLSLGLVFLVGQGFEWAHLLHYGLTTNSSLYGAIFYTIVGAHAVHVLAAVGVLAWVLQRARTQEHNACDSGVGWLAPYRMYWLFVVGVWPVLYTLLYWT